MIRRAVAVVATVAAAVTAVGCRDAVDRRPAAPSSTAAMAPARPGSTTSTTTASSDAVVAGFIAFGDFGGGDAQLAVAAQMSMWAAAHRVDALVTVGDNVYPSGEASRFASELDAPYATLRATRPLWATLGNHDVLTGDGGDAQLHHLGLPRLPFVETLPDTQLLFLDANHPDAAQAAWLEQRLTEPGPRFRVVLFHQPAWSCGLHGSTDPVDQLWVPVLERHRVALVLNGHDHQYERFVSGADVTYVVTGGGGQTLYPMFRGCRAGAREVAGEVVHHFTAVEVRDRSLTLTAVAVDGRVIDRAVIAR